MALYSPYASGLGNSAAYQVAGKPYMTGSTVEAYAFGAEEIKIEFPTVAKSLYFQHTGSQGTAMRISLDSTAEGSGNNRVNNGNHFFILYPASTSGSGEVRLEGKFKEIYVSNIYFGGVYPQTGFKLFAELTGIPSTEMYELTGSGINA